MMQCKACGSNSIGEVYDFGRMPLVNAFYEDYTESSYAPNLNLVYCRMCKVCQLEDAPSVNKLFSKYKHFSGASIDNVNHLNQVATFCSDFQGGLKDANVLEIGCNDGTLLKEFIKLEANVIGCDAAVNMAELEIHKILNTVFTPFGPEAARLISDRFNFEKFDLVVGLNVFAHYDSVYQSFCEIANLLDPNSGLFMFEVAYALDTVFAKNYDTIYHEHLFNHTLLGLKSMLSRAKMKIVYAQRISTQGGSLRVVATGLSNSNAYPQGSLQEIMQFEDDIGLNADEFYAKSGLAIKASINERKDALQKFLKNYNSVVLAGSPARGVVFANTMREVLCDKELLPLDDTKEKLGMYFPGFQCKVESFQSLSKLHNPPKAAILLSWNYKNTIIEKLRMEGFSGKVFVPFPDIEILEV